MENRAPRARAGAPGAQKVTIEQLADLLGVSIATVSYALNDRPGVSEETRRRVKSMADQLGWRPSSSARALARSKAGTVGAVVSRSSTGSSDGYYMRFLAGAEKVLATAGTTLLIRVIDADEDAHREVYRQWVAEHRVDGAILSELRVGDRRVQLLDELGLPWVIHSEPGPYNDYASVGYDNDTDAGTLVEHLAGLGHRSVCYVSGSLAFVHERDRISALERHCARTGVEFSTIEGSYSLQAGQAAVADGVLGGARPEAILFGNDLLARGGTTVLVRAGVAVPRDVSVLSWGDSHLCEFLDPPLSALRREDPESQGAASARLLLDLLAGEPSRTVVAAPSVLVDRGSTAAR